MTERRQQERRKAVRLAGENVDWFGPGRTEKRHNSDRRVCRCESSWAVTAEYGHDIKCPHNSEYSDRRQASGAARNVAPNVDDPETWRGIGDTYAASCETTATGEGREELREWWQEHQRYELIECGSLDKLKRIIPRLLASPTRTQPATEALLRKGIEIARLIGQPDYTRDGLDTANRESDLRQWANEVEAALSDHRAATPAAEKEGE